ncbi:MAG: PSK operon transcription factor [Rhodospirillaceae bacterium]|nr:type II toxin-antitoxin system VapB family antitoxin [Rhodospirillaceae bacterium]MDE0616734.1 type II toxin-antitoxin system VapB family antitoxin [Rhodospirillaceae bacterium]MDE0718643.1 type II toxin-antitoxin system VapB family antitoxin [Rhodospirillaceae bacterium]MYF09106.1 PSK operon transcription factor [Rhodospirillaceae bacterium]MYJ71064.1 PSK operon transcription factor [Rhodospirillaceae bacterium]
MPLNIDDPEIDRLARELAEATGESIDAAVKTAIEQRLTRECSAEYEGKRKLEAAREIVARTSALRWKDSGKSAREMVEELYDENGLPK